MRKKREDAGDNRQESDDANKDYFGYCPLFIYYPKDNS
jgi:hypothetical protein